MVFRIAIRPLLILVLLTAVFLSGCGGTPTPTPTHTPEVTTLNLRALLGTSDLAVGANRLVFALLGPTGAPVRASWATLSLSYVQDDTPVPQGEAQAVFRQWPGSSGGVFTAQLDFSKAGKWLAEITPIDGDMKEELARLTFQVQEQSATPALGAPAPHSQNRTSRDVATLDDLTSDPNPDPDLYAMSIAQALEMKRPLVVTFATPAFCSSATCGPQVDVVKDIKKAYGNHASFIHVEIYDNPKEMQGDTNNARVAPTVDQWGLPSEPWTFITDSQGKVAAKFEGFTSYGELEEALKQVLLP
jgi:hypothetical protein